ncbi:MAG: nitronate monooxygenase [Alphaproteobacteria bacterium]|nr:nitronate monooxygenase [Alphaproteobacteria bacterium]
MTWIDTAIAERLDIAWPIVQGPLGGGLSPVPLVVAVSEAGGLGSYGASSLTPPEIATVAAEIRARTAKPFALNLWVGVDPAPRADRAAFDRARDRLAPFLCELGVDLPTAPTAFGQDFDAQAEAVLAAAPAVFSFVFGIPPSDVLRECRRRHIYTIGTATTVAEALALEEAGVDAVAATGAEAGGMRPSFLPAADDPLLGTFALVPQVASAVRIPVIAAGGIVDGRGVAAALALGAQAVQLGTAFLACAESGAPTIHRDALFGKDRADTVLSRAVNGRPARVMRNRLAEELAAHPDAIAPFPIQGWLVGALRKAAIAQDRTDLIGLQASQAAPLLRHRDAATLIDALVDDTSRILDALSSRRDAAPPRERTD